MPQLRSPGFLLRPFVASDAPAFAAAVRESEKTVGAWMTWAHAEYTEAEALSWFASCESSRAQGTAHEFGIFREDGATLLGGSGLNQFNAVNGFCNLATGCASRRKGKVQQALLSPYSPHSHSPNSD